MTQILLYWPFILAAAAAASLGVLQVKRDEARQRIEDLDLVKRALEAHYKAVDILVNDPATTPEMLKAVELINRVMGDRDFVDLFFKSGGDSLTAPAHLSPNSTSAFGQAQSLKATRPQIADAFHNAISNAVTVIFLRWPGRSAAYRRFLTGAVSAPKDEVIVAEKIVDLGIRKSRRDKDDFMPGAAMA